MSLEDKEIMLHTGPIYKELDRQKEKAAKFKKQVKALKEVLGTCKTALEVSSWLLGPRMSSGDIGIEQAISTGTREKIDEAIVLAEKAINER